MNQNKLLMQLKTVKILLQREDPTHLAAEAARNLLQEIIDEIKSERPTETDITPGPI